MLNGLRDHTNNHNESPINSTIGYVVKMDTYSHFVWSITETGTVVSLNQFTFNMNLLCLSQVINLKQLLGILICYMSTF
jgi:hypothetical protein